MRQIGCRIAVVALGLFAVASAGWAASGNYRPYMLGDRAAGMGGAVAASAEGIDACYYNPGGLVWTERDSLSLSANLYGFRRTTVDDAFFPGESFTSDSFVSIPSSVGGTARFSDEWAGAFSVFVPEQDSFFEIRSFKEDQHFYTMSADSQTLWLGPALSHRLNSTWSWGLGVYGVYATYHDTLNLFWGDEAVSYARGVKTRSMQALALAGIQWRHEDGWQAGAAFQTPSWVFSGEGEILASVVQEQRGNTISDFQHIEDMDVDDGAPARFVAGFGWQKKRKASVGLDLTYFFEDRRNALSGKDQDGEQVDFHLRRDAVLDLSLGGEYYVREKYPLRLGFFTSRSANPDPPAQDDEFNLINVDLYGITSTIGVEGKNLSMNVGFNYVFGNGSSTGWSVESGEIVPDKANAKVKSLLFVLSTAYMF